MKRIITLAICFALMGTAGLTTAKAQTQSIQILYPTGGEQFAVGSSQTIKWSAPASVARVNISITSAVKCPVQTGGSVTVCTFMQPQFPIAQNVSNSGSYIWNIPANQNAFSPGTFVINITDAAGGGLTQNSNMFTITGNLTDSAVHPAGTNILLNGTIYYVQPTVIGGAMPINPPLPTLVPYSSPEVYLSYGFNSWRSVTLASAGDAQLTKNANLMIYADGSLVNDNGTVYLISNGQKNGITNSATFLTLGYSWSNEINGDTSFVPTGNLISTAGVHMPGTLINQNGTIYYISPYGKMGFDSMNSFNSWGFNLKDVVAANYQDSILNTNPYSALVANWSIGELTPTVGPALAIPFNNLH